MAISINASADESQLLLTAQPAAPTNGKEAIRESLFQKHSIGHVAGSLGIVVGGFLLVTAMLRKQQGPIASSATLLETLGEAQVTPQTKLHLVRLGSRLLVLHLTPTNVNKVAEISDPEEVNSLLSAYYSSSPSNETPSSVSELLNGLNPESLVMRSTA